MGQIPTNLTSDERVRNLEDQVRRLWTRLPENHPWPWYSLCPYLCGGWVDWGSDHPFRYDIPDGVTPKDTAGFYDTGNVLIFTGEVSWDPENWWASPPYNPTSVANPALQGNPQIYKDSDRMVAISDGLGNTIGGVFSPDDLGFPLPYSGPWGYFNFSQRYAPYYPRLDVVNPDFAPTGEFWMIGGRSEMTLQEDTSGLGADSAGTLFTDMTVSQTGRYMKDPDDFVHPNVPAGTTLSLQNFIMPYNRSIKIIDPHTIISIPARTQDRFLGVPDPRV